MRVGNVPKQWYDLYDHKGYSVDGKAVTKMIEGDELEKFIERQSDPMWWAKITDYLNNKQVKLSTGDLEMLRRVREGKFADSTIDPYAPFDYEVESKDFIHPLSGVPDPKRRFVPSKNERLRVSKYVQALKKGWMKTLAEKEQEEKDKEEKFENAWDIWQDDSIVTWKPKKMPKPITAPKRDLPMHAESYNPSDEYLFDDKEKKEWLEQDELDRKLNYIPSKIDALRKVPLYTELIKEHFERCLDLYMCPRLFKQKVNVSDPSKLIPELPSPSELKPFPTQVSIDFHFHTKCVRTISISPNGMWLASGDDDSNLVIWNAKTTKIVRQYKMPNKVIDRVMWCPNEGICLLAVANEETVHLVHPGLGTNEVNKTTKDIVFEASKSYKLESAAIDKKD